MKENRRQRLKDLLERKFKGDRGALITASGLTKGRISQLLDPEQPFGDVTARRLAQALSLPDDYFEQPPEPGTPPAVLDHEKAASPRPIPLPPGAVGLRPASMVPVVGTTQGGPPNRAWEELGYPVGNGDQYVEVATSDPHAYALRVVGDSMAPRIMEGEWIVVEPGTEPLPGDEVVVKTRDDEVMVKTLSARHGDTVVLSSVNEAFKRITLHVSQLAFIHFVGPRIPQRLVKTRVDTPEYHGPDRRAQGRTVEVERRSTAVRITSEGKDPGDDQYSRIPTSQWGTI